MVECHHIVSKMILSILLCFAIIAKTDSFLPQADPMVSFPLKGKGVSFVSAYTKSSKSHTTIDSVASTSSSALYVYADPGEEFLSAHFFAISALFWSAVGSISSNIGRTSRMNLAWEERLREGQAQKKQDDPNDTRNELDLMAEVAEMSLSAYGQEATERRSREGYEYNEDDAMSDEEIQEFEEKYKIKYDPYYDQGYYEDELPTDVECTTTNYGDRVYEDGEMFFLHDGLFYRLGAMPKSPKLISWKEIKKRP